MGLKTLLSDLSSEQGGFRQKTIGYNDHIEDTSIYGQDAQPFIEYGFDGNNNVINFGNKQTDALDKAGELDAAAGDLIRGGTQLQILRRYTDYKRIEKFLRTPKGEQFLTQQVGLQLSNPRVDAPMKGALDNLFAFGLNPNNPPDPNQTEYNPLISTNKTLLQVGLSGLYNTAREGMVPFVHFGYYNNFFKRNGSNKIYFPSF